MPLLKNALLFSQAVYLGQLLLAEENIYDFPSSLLPSSFAPQATCQAEGVKCIELVYWFLQRESCSPSFICNRMEVKIRNVNVISGKCQNAIFQLPKCINRMLMGF